MLGSILRVLDDPALARTLGESGRRYARDRLSRTHATDRILGFVTELAEGRRAR